MMPIVRSPLAFLSIHDVDIVHHLVIHDSLPDYPSEILAARPHLESAYAARFEYFHRVVDNEMPRLLKVILSPGAGIDARSRLQLTFNRTSFVRYLVTNRSLDVPVVAMAGQSADHIDKKTLRQVFVQPLYDDLESSVLANPLAVMICVISRNPHQNPPDQIIIRKRSDRVASYRGRYTLSAGGYMELSHQDEDGKANPFVTAITESREEIADDFQLAPEDYKLLGVALSWEDMLPCVYGYIYTDRLTKDLCRGKSQDAFEGQTLAIPFTPADVLGHLAHHPWTPESVLALFDVLRAHFPHDEVERAAAAIPARGVADFFEDAPSAASPESAAG